MLECIKALKIENNKWVQTIYDLVDSVNLSVRSIRRTRYLSHHDIYELEPKGIEPSTSALRMRNILVYFAPVRTRQFETDIAKHLVLKQFLEID